MACTSCDDCTGITLPQGLIGPAGPQGPAGSNGTNGANGVSVLYSNFADQPTTSVTTWQTLDSFTIPANTLSTDGTGIEISSVFTSNNRNNPLQTTRILFNNNNLNVNPSVIIPSFYSGILETIKYTIYIARTSNTEATVELIITHFSNTGNGVRIQRQPMDILTSLDFNTVAYTVKADAWSIVSGDITGESLIITKYSK